MEPLFIIDTNVFIQAHRTTYPLDIVPGFWEKIIDLANRDKIISIDKVKNEIYKNDDELKAWCKVNLPENSGKIQQSHLLPMPSLLYGLPGKPIDTPREQ